MESPSGAYALSNFPQRLGKAGEKRSKAFSVRLSNFIIWVWMKMKPPGYGQVLVLGSIWQGKPFWVQNSGPQPFIQRLLLVEQNLNSLARQLQVSLPLHLLSTSISVCACCLEGTLLRMTKRSAT